MAHRREAMFARPRRLLAWLNVVRLSPRAAALLGGGAGAVVGLAVALSMRRHAVFSQPYQDVTAGAALVVLWLCIGVVAGLTVLSPDDGVPDEGGGR